MTDQDTALMMRALAYLIGNQSPYPGEGSDVNAEILGKRADELDARRLAGTDTGEGYMRPGHFEDSDDAAREPWLRSLQLARFIEEPEDGGS